MTSTWASRNDGELLRAARSDPDAFGELYRRHEAVVLAYLAKRSRDPEMTADLAAETFVTALMQPERFRDDGAPAIGWLLGIARNLLLEAWRRKRIDDRARRRLGAERTSMSDATLERIESLIDADASTPVLARALAALPDTQRLAVQAFVLDEQPYAELARQLGIPEATVRQRVSRGLARLRTTLEGPR
ncbi:sigma-70 family RNA polymerase sigma factor [Patulibacter sp. NPDC049589]|uniref:RNA polymerase sigma factor n=1 Tax=Patulibacter sp. NPDC049589 TaxID=3154731 RepID=UPI0034485A35